MSATDVPEQRTHWEATAWLRETLEERGISFGDVAGTRSLGLVRELIRGGKPEMSFLLRTRLSAEKLLLAGRSAKDRHEWTAQHLLIPFGGDALEPMRAADAGAAHEFLSRIDVYLARHGGEASWPLFCAIGPWRKWRLSWDDPRRPDR